MSSYAPHTLETAPEAARPLLRSVQSSYGFLPNLAAVMAASPALLEGYLGLSAAFAKTSLTPAEQQVVLLSASVVNGCGYCVAAHSTVAQRTKLGRQAIEGLRSQGPLGDARLEALRAFTVSVVESRGRPSDADVQAFLDAGYDTTQVFEVLLGVGVKILTNYTNHIADTPLDDVFAPQRWEPVGASA